MTRIVFASVVDGDQRKRAPWGGVDHLLKGTPLFTTDRK